MSTSAEAPLFRAWPSGSGAATTVHAGHVALAIGFGRTFSWELSAITTWSFDRAVTAVESTTQTQMVVLTDEPAHLAPHRAAVPRLIVQPFNLAALRKVWRIRATSLMPQDSVWFRFALITSYIERHCSAAELVLLFDLKDVLFQASPFELAPRSSATGRAKGALTSFTEAFPVRRGSWNHKAMLNFKDVNGTMLLIDEIVRRQPLSLNSGLLLGPPHVVCEHTRRITLAVLQIMPLPKDAFMGVDQGAHNLLVYGAMSSTTPVGSPWGTKAESKGSGANDQHHIVAMNLQGTAPVLTMHMIDPLLYTCDDVDTNRPGSSVFRLRSNRSGAPYVMVHQWNRAPETVQRALLCHHRHLLSLSHLSCGPRTACMPFRPEKSLVPQEEREILHKLSFPSLWQKMCPKSTGCKTDTDMAVRLRATPNAGPAVAGDHSDRDRYEKRQ